METQPQSPQQAGAAQGQVRDPASLSSASLRRPQRGATILIAGALLLTAAIFARPSMAGADAAFEVTDDPGRWFRNVAGPIGGSQSLAVIQPGGRITLSWKSKSVHTVTSLIFPTGATGMPFDSGLIKGGGDLILRTPGLYVFVCKVHPYMLGAVIVDDPNTTGLDLGDSITLVNGITSRPAATWRRDSSGRFSLLPILPTGRIRDRRCLGMSPTRTWTSELISGW